MLSDDLAHGFWCECWAEDLRAPGGPTVTTSFGAYTAPQADGWLPTALRAITAELNHAAPKETWDWLYESRIDTRRALLRSEPCTASVTYASTRITWTVHPVLFLPLADSHKSLNSQHVYATSCPMRPTELQLSLLIQGGSLRSPHAARPSAGPALLSPPRSSPAADRAAR